MCFYVKKFMEYFGPWNFMSFYITLTFLEDNLFVSNIKIMIVLCRVQITDVPIIFLTVNNEV